MTAETVRGQPDDSLSSRIDVLCYRIHKRWGTIESLAVVPVGLALLGLLRMLGAPEKVQATSCFLTFAVAAVIYGIKIIGLKRESQAFEAMLEGGQ